MQKGRLCNGMRGMEEAIEGLAALEKDNEEVGIDTAEGEAG